MIGIARLIVSIHSGNPLVEEEGRGVGKEKVDSAVFLLVS